jgi:DNA-binding phage protein
MSTVWGCAFEDFLTREFEDGSNIVDDYLKRRGWKEGASSRAYMAALRTSVMSLYEVSHIARDTSSSRGTLCAGANQP